MEENKMKYYKIKTIMKNPKLDDPKLSDLERLFVAIGMYADCFFSEKFHPFNMIRKLEKIDPMGYYRSKQGYPSMKIGLKQELSTSTLRILRQTGYRTIKINPAEYKNRRNYKLKHLYGLGICPF